ncbi:VOC family protein [Planctomycetaceae bacterium SH139]
MRNPFIHGVGGVISADIAVPDHEREVAFYSSILSTGNAPLWRDDLMNNLGTPIIGLGARTPEYDSLPLQWMPHFQVADVAASAMCALDMGGKELMHGKSDDGQSQWAVLVAPDGSAFGIIPVVPHQSPTAHRNTRAGCISWLSLAVPDASASRDFYQQVIGWKAKSIETQNNDELAVKFEMQVDNETIAAEIFQFRGEQTEIPSVWLIHLPVGDFEESVRRVKQGGGAVVKQFAEPKYAIVRDPVGVHLALHPGE